MLQLPESSIATDPECPIDLFYLNKFTVSFQKNQRVYVKIQELIRMKLKFTRSRSGEKHFTTNSIPERDVSFLE